MDFDRIVVEPDKLEGKPTIRGLRITVETVIRLVAAGWTFDEILAEYPYLEREDVTEALEYAAVAVNLHATEIGHGTGHVSEAASRQRSTYGILAGRVHDVSADEIAEVRREIWGDLADDN